MKHSHLRYLSLILFVAASYSPSSLLMASEVVKPAVTGADAPVRNDEKASYDKTLPPLKIEKTGNVTTLPRSYPESWVMVDESSFFGMASGKVIILDLAEAKPAKRIKGIVDKSFLGNIAESKTRSELYVLETFHKRGTRGPKEDVLAIYDKETLTIKKEIVWPKPKRLQSLPERFAMSLSKDERLLYSANFDPASSFTVIDLDSQEIVTEVGTPGCILTFPLGLRSVASLCSNGSMLSTKLNLDGTLKSQSRSEPFFDTDDTPIFEHAVYLNDIAYFWSFKGMLHTFDMSGDEAVYQGKSDMLSKNDKEGDWRPSGLILNDVDDRGYIYTIFQPDGKEGTQTHGGSQIRVYDPINKKLINTIEAPRWAITLAVTRGDNPLLVVTNGELNLDVFNAHDGAFIHTISDFGGTTPLAIYKLH